jgi:hypothetical protein
MPPTSDISRVRRRTDDKLVRKHVHMDADDWQWLQDHLEIGPSEAVRAIIKTFRKNAEKRMGQIAQRPQVSDPCGND